LIDRWPAAVGAAIARSAWPSRIARDGTLHVNTADSVWAFELTQQATEIAARLGVETVRFSPGPLAGGGEETPPQTVRKPLPEEVRDAAALTAGIEDEKLRQSVERAASLSIARAASDRPL
jgi:hypothetical protein